jgi:hypothetical protein
MVKRMLLSALLITQPAFVPAAFGQQKSDKDDSNGGIVYGIDHAFGIVAPAGWVLDNASGIPEGLHAVFYPKGGSWKGSPVVMYANTVHKGETNPKTMLGIVADDTAAFKSRAKTSIISDERRLATKGKEAAIVKGFSDEAREVYERVAYIDEPKVVVMLVLSGHNKAGVAAALPAFRDLVASYFFVTSTVTEKP